MSQSGRYYVVWRRSYIENLDMISLYTEDEAKAGNWIDANGDRIWVVPADSERMITGVFRFDELDDALAFHEGFKHQLGRRVVEDV